MLDQAPPQAPDPMKPILRPDILASFETPPLANARPPRCPPFVEITDPEGTDISFTNYAEYLDKKRRTCGFGRG